MKHRVARAALLALLVLTGGLGAGPATAQQGAPASTGFRDEGTELVHEASGMRFPAQVGNAVRLPIDPTDVQDEYVVVRYRIPLERGGEATARIGIIHIEGMTPREHYAAFSPVILGRLPGAKVRHQGAFTVPGAIGKGYRGWFTGTDRAAGLITANFGHWSARLISDYPLAQTAQARAAITRLATTLDWSPLQKAAATP